jgi:hypothetical protein
MAVGEDLDSGGGAREGGAGARREPRWLACGWHGPRWWRRSVRRQRGGSRHGAGEQSVRRRCGGGRRGVEADAEEEQVSTGV